MRSLRYPWATSAAPHEATRDVEQPPPHRLRTRHAPGTLEAEELESGQEIGRQHHCGHPRLVGGELLEREATEPGVLQALDVDFDVGVSPHRHVDVDRVAVRAAGSHLHRRRAVAVHLGDAFLVGILWLQTPSVPLLEGPFRGRAAVSSRGAVNDWVSISSRRAGWTVRMEVVR